MADPLRRITTPTRKVLAVFMNAPGDEHYGLDIADTAGLKSGSLYPILARLEDHGWLTSRWEDLNPSDEGRPRRRYYKITADGINLAKQALASHGSAWLNWRPGGVTP